MLERVAAAQRAMVVPNSLGGQVGAITTTEPDEAARTADCGCCRVRVDLIDAVRRAVHREPRPSSLVVVVDLDDPAGNDVVTAVYTLLSDVDLARLVRLDAVVVTCDAVELATRLAVDDPSVPPVRPSDVEALAIADRVLLARADAVTPAALHRVEAGLRVAAPFAQVLAPGVRGVGPLDLFGIDAWHGPPAVPDRGLDAAAPAGPDCITLVQHGALDADAVDEWFDELVARYANSLIRLQGVIAPRGRDEYVCCHGVRSFARSHPASDYRLGDDSRVAVVGWGLDASALAESFRSTLRD